MRPQDEEWSSIRRGASAESFRFLDDAEVRELLDLGAEALRDRAAAERRAERRRRLALAAGGDHAPDA